MAVAYSRLLSPALRSGLLLVFLLLFFLALAPRAALAQKTDIVILTNGDRVTGEIKKLEAGILQYKTDSMGTVRIEWRFIDTIITDKQQVIETTDGDRWLGKIQKPEASEDVQVVTVAGPVDIDPRDIVSAWPVEATFLDKMDLSFSLGYEYQSATGIGNFSGASDFLYRTDARVIDATLRANITTQDEAEAQERLELRFSYQRLLEDWRFRSLIASYESNEALGLDRRITGGGVFGKYLRKTNLNWLHYYVGVVGNIERSIGGEDTESVEGVLGTRWRYFQYAAPERVLDTSLNVFPSLTESGRWRGDLRTTFKLELVSDLFWTMELFATYDSDPLDVDANQEDYGIITGFGWSY
ncbi:MAG: DUF481 domain-containing protein [Xanthomonadales bacterium]|jgi:hypothetical protein|nr:DUF481 domain-containing protein [Xanthomonadales bacterium]